jgi:hypothetical protein
LEKLGAALANGVKQEVPPPTEGGKVIFELLLVTIPPVLLYFVGWVYLRAYLGAFGINMSELNLDIQTFFIYSIPPIRFSGYITLVVVAVPVVMFVLLARLLKGTKLDSYVRRTSMVTRLFWVVLILAILALLSVPAITWTAIQVAKRKWTSDFFPIEAMIKAPENKEQSFWFEQYYKCGERLDLVFSDKESYYMLCRSTLDSTAGYVYEVRRGGGLASVRFATSP